MLIILIVIILIWWLYKHREHLSDNVEYYDFHNSDSPFICLIAGTHGNEPAGTIALGRWIKYLQDKKIVRGHIRIIPKINKWGLDRNIRYQDYFGILPYSDINRNYNESGGTDNISRHVIELTRNADLVIDFHEGWGYHICQPTSIGSTLTPTDYAADISAKIVDAINSTGLVGCKKFLSIPNESCKIESTLACYMQNNRRPYILVETTGQNNIQPLDVRINQIDIVINTVLRDFNML
jgi:predicted deacylase